MLLDKSGSFNIGDNDSWDVFEMTGEPIKSTTGEVGAARCNYCGRENNGGTTVCKGCGSALSGDESVEEPKAKSRAAAVGLALLAGPVGLLYVRAWLQALVIVIAANAFIFAGARVVYVLICSRITCMILAYRATSGPQPDTSVRDKSTRLLNEAARLESVDRCEAMRVYEDIIRMYPDTPASKEATDNLEVLKREQTSAGGADARLT